jgi:hypothetical protein
MQIANGGVVRVLFTPASYKVSINVAFEAVALIGPHDEPFI